MVFVGKKAMTTEAVPLKCRKTEILTSIWSDDRHPPLGMMKEPTSKPNEHTKMMSWYYHNLVIVCIVF